MKNKFFILLIAIALLLTTLAGCSGGNDSSADGGADETIAIDQGEDDVKTDMSRVFTPKEDYCYNDFDSVKVFKRIGS